MKILIIFRKSECITSQSIYTASSLPMCCAHHSVVHTTPRSLHYNPIPTPLTTQPTLDSLAASTHTNYATDNTPPHNPNTPSSYHPSIPLHPLHTTLQPPHTLITPITPNTYSTYHSASHHPTHPQHTTPHHHSATEKSDGLRMLRDV